VYRQLGFTAFYRHVNAQIQEQEDRIRELQDNQRAPKKRKKSDQSSRQKPVPDYIQDSSSDPNHDLCLWRHTISFKDIYIKQVPGSQQILLLITGRREAKTDEDLVVVHQQRAAYYMSKFKSHYSGGNMAVFLETVIDEWLYKISCKGWVAEVILDDEECTREYDDQEDAEPLRQKLELIMDNIDDFIEIIQRWAREDMNIVGSGTESSSLDSYILELQEARRKVMETFVHILDMGPRKIYESRSMRALPHMPRPPTPPPLRVRRYKRSRKPKYIGDNN
jgi:hypothetical protein